MVASTSGVLRSSRIFSAKDSCATLIAKSPGRHRAFGFLRKKRAASHFCGALLIVLMGHCLSRRSCIPSQRSLPSCAVVRTFSRRGAKAFSGRKKGEVVGLVCSGGGETYRCLPTLGEKRFFHLPSRLPPPSSAPRPLTQTRVRWR